MGKKRKKRGPYTMTKRQKLYKENRCRGMSQYNAAIAAGYSHAYAVSACRIEKTVAVKHSINDYFERAGLTDKVIAERVEELTRAETLKTTKTKVYTVADNSARLKALELAGRFTGKLNNKVEVEGKMEHTGEFLAALVARAG